METKIAKFPTRAQFIAHFVGIFFFQFQFDLIKIINYFVILVFYILTGRLVGNNLMNGISVSNHRIASSKSDIFQRINWNWVVARKGMIDTNKWCSSDGKREEKRHFRVRYTRRTYSKNIKCAAVHLPPTNKVIILLKKSVKCSKQVEFIISVNAHRFDENRLLCNIFRW